MKFLILWFTLSFSFSVLSLSVGYVNLDEVLKKTKEGRSIQNKVKKEFEKRRSQIQKREKKIQEEKMKLDQEAGLLSDSERRKRAQKMQQQIVEFQQSVQTNQKELSEYEMRLVTNLVQKMEPIIGKIAEKKKISRVERLTENIFWVPSEYNLTSQVVQSYNKKYK